MNNCLNCKYCVKYMAGGQACGRDEEHKNISVGQSSRKGPLADSSTAQSII
jgi:hypothetical protein